MMYSKELQTGMSGKERSRGKVYPKGKQDTITMSLNLSISFEITNYSMVHDGAWIVQ